MNDQTTTPPLDLAALRNTAEAATTGPWIIDELETGEHGLFVDEDNPDYQALGCGLSQVAGFMEGKNARHIAAFDPPTAMALIDRVNDSEAEASRYRGLYDEAESALTAAEATIARVREALSNHPKQCDKHTEASPITCGWKRAVADVTHALDGGA